VGMLAYANFAVGYFEPQERRRRTEQITVRIPKPIQDGLDRLAKLWTHLERLRTEDEKAEVTVSDVVNRLLEVGLDGAWSEAGFRPKTDQELLDLQKRAEKILLEQQRNKK